MSGKTIEEIRRDAQARADFWSEQAAKNAEREGHYLVIASQFQRIANDLRSVTVELPEWPKPL